MRNGKSLLIGGGPASIRAAKQIRSLDSDGFIYIACDEPLAPYDRPPLSKEYLGGGKPVEDLYLETDGLLTAENITCALSQAVSRLDPTRKVAILADGEEIEFDKALIATGGRPVRLDLPGAELDGVHYLRTAQDADELSADALPGRRA